MVRVNSSAVSRCFCSHEFISPWFLCADWRGRKDFPIRGTVRLAVVPIARDFPPEVEFCQVTGGINGDYVLTRRGGKPMTDDYLCEIIRDAVNGLGLPGFLAHGPIMSVLGHVTEKARDGVHAAGQPQGARWQRRGKVGMSVECELSLTPEKITGNFSICSGILIFWSERSTSPFLLDQVETFLNTLIRNYIAEVRSFGGSA